MRERKRERLRDKGCVRVRERECCGTIRSKKRDGHYVCVREGEKVRERVCV